MYAGSNSIKNIVCIVDYNKVQLASTIAEAVSLEPMKGKWQAFNWNVMECDGHNMKDVLSTLSSAKEKSSDGPVAVIAHTVKGKGVSFMEGRYQWHGKAPNDEEFQTAIKEVCAGGVK